MFCAVRRRISQFPWKAALETVFPLANTALDDVPTATPSKRYYTTDCDDDDKTRPMGGRHYEAPPSNVNQLQTAERLQSRYSFDVLLEGRDSGGHVIFASEDGLDPVLSEIRFAADAIYHNYPYVWFRDHCRCPACADGNARSRVSAEALDPSIEPVLDKTTNLGSSVSILWKDGHFSQYPASWLWAHRFGERASRDILDPSRCVRWDADRVSKSLKRFEFKGLLEDDELLLDWLLELRIRGIAIIQDAPEGPSQVDQLGERVGFLRRCHFGSTFEETIRYETDKDGGLSLETDLPYSLSPPGVHLLHCVAQECPTGTGDAAGLLLSDGLHASEVLRDEEPHSLEVLSRMEWEYFYLSENGEYHQRAMHPAIRFDSKGQFTQVVFNDRLRGPGAKVPANFVSPAYESLKKYVAILNRTENVFEYSMKPGEIIARDNRRVLHKRAPVKSPGFESKLESAYLDWDEITSKVRVLYKRLKG